MMTSLWYEEMLQAGDVREHYRFPVIIFSIIFHSLSVKILKSKVTAHKRGLSETNQLCCLIPN